MEQMMLSEQLEVMMKKYLNERERHVIKLRFGMEDGRNWKLNEIAQEYHLCMEWIRKIEKRALKKMAEPQRSRMIQDYLRG